MLRDMDSFDRTHAKTLERIWFLGDVHGQFAHIDQALRTASVLPRWLVFLGDIDIERLPFQEVLAPLRRDFPDVGVAFIHGNHDADTHQHWAMLHNCGDARILHGQVLDLDGVRVAGLGGNFLGKIWCPPAAPSFLNQRTAARRSPYPWRGEGAADAHHPKLLAAIYPDDVKALSRQRADILVTHEAPSCHPHGFAALDELARALRVVRTFHGHHHDDRSDAYALERESLGFDARAVSYCGIKNGLGDVIHAGEAGW
jgi:Calcineurin-like phosphoesterase